MIKFYIISTIISSLITIVWIKAERAKLTKEGYRTKKEKTSIWVILQTIIFFLIPILNIIIAIAAIFKSDALRESLKKESIPPEATNADKRAD